MQDNQAHHHRRNHPNKITATNIFQVKFTFKKNLFINATHLVAIGPLCMILLFDHDKGTLIAILKTCCTHSLQLMEAYLNPYRQKKPLLLLEQRFIEDLHQISNTLTVMVTQPLVPFQKFGSFYS